MPRCHTTRSLKLLSAENIKAQTSAAERMPQKTTHMAPTQIFCAARVPIQTLATSFINFVAVAVGRVEYLTKAAVIGGVPAKPKARVRLVARRDSAGA